MSLVRRGHAGHYPPELVRATVQFARQELAAGSTLGDVAWQVKIRKQTLDAWLEAARPTPVRRRRARPEQTSLPAARGVSAVPVVLRVGSLDGQVSVFGQPPEVRPSGGAIPLPARRRGVGLRFAGAAAASPRIPR